MFFYKQRRRLKKAYFKYKLKYKFRKLTNSKSPLASSLGQFLIQVEGKTSFYPDLESVKKIREKYLNYSETEENFTQGFEFKHSIVPISEIYSVASSPLKWGKLIYELTLIIKPKEVLELGTNLGISGAYFIEAFKLNGFGKLSTIEASHRIYQTADKTLSQFGRNHYFIHNGLFADVLPKILKTQQNYQLVFIDGHHQKEPTKAYFETIFPHLDKEALVIFDDIDWSEGMKEFWSEHKKDPKTKITVDLGRWGISLFSRVHNLKKQELIIKV